MAQLFLPGVAIQQAVERRTPATHVAGTQRRNAKRTPEGGPLLRQRLLQRRPLGALRLKTRQRGFFACEVSGLRGEARHAACVASGGVGQPVGALASPFEARDAGGQSRAAKGARFAKEGGAQQAPFGVAGCASGCDQLGGRHIASRRQRVEALAQGLHAGLHLGHGALAIAPGGLRFVEALSEGGDGLA